ncbi:MAG: sulfite exporter TauE/SafE family protein [Rhizobiales bacterium]|nr:sulfite exporter TauE/SafE family protein [Hyphomicrobiales bacterium]
MAAGSVVGFSLGLIGGGGSILAVPLILYLVGVGDPHVAIGTAAVAVAASAAFNLANHARQGMVRWHCALVFAAAGVVGAFGGSSLGKIVDGQRLIFLFALLMIVIGVLMLRPRAEAGNATVTLTRSNTPALIVLGFISGALAGFFGIGGGFLIVPGLMLATGMPISNAICSSLVAVTAFGLTTAANYAISNLVDWRIAILFLAGAVFGGLAGAELSKHLSVRRGALNKVFAALVFAAAAYVIYRTQTAS